MVINGLKSKINTPWFSSGSDASRRFDFFSHFCFQLKWIKWKLFINPINIPHFSGGFNVIPKGHDILTFLYLQVWSEKAPKKGYQRLTLMFQKIAIRHPHYWEGHSMQRNYVLEIICKEILTKYWNLGYCVQTALNISFALSCSWHLCLFWLQSQLLILSDKPDVYISHRVQGHSLLTH